MKRTITVLASLLAVLLLAGCDRVETKKLAGTWYCDIDVTERMNEAAETALGLSAGADGAMALRMVFTVQPDGAYTLGYDLEAIRAALDGYAATLHEAAVERIYAAAEAQGYSREEYDEAMTSAGISVEDMADAVFDGVDDGELTALLTGGSETVSGWCKAINGKLLLADSADIPEDAAYIAYTLENETTLRWTDDGGALASQLTETEQASVQLPLTWTKVVEE